MSDELSPRRRRRPPKGDHLRPRPIKRTPAEEEEAQVSRLLTHSWNILSPAERQESLECARIQGEVLAEGFGGLPDGVDEGDYNEAYRRSAVRVALAARVINHAEAECWRWESRDPRVRAFENGVRSVLGAAAPTRAPARPKKSSRSLREVDRLMHQIERFMDDGGEAAEWLKRAEMLGAVPPRTLCGLRQRLVDRGLLDE